ncbi:response regulator [Microvirga lotononidis]|uniref:Response regulator n=2 Tax=Microvirga lotononidis TaxID=864069 RepID=I4YMY5_9HYPH|nr:response regulator [Microvirga lotononidis]
MRQPEAGDLTIPRELKARRIRLPVIVLGELQSDVKSAVQVMKAGAVDFLPVPYAPDELLAALASAAADISQADEHGQESNRARGRIAEMPVREREVLEGLLAGQTNKQIGRDIGISPRTVETHRAHVMQRLGVQTLPQAVLVAPSAGFESLSPGRRCLREQISLKPDRLAEIPAQVLFSLSVGGVREPRCIKQSGISLRDHPQHFPPAQTFMSHDP